MKACADISVVPIGAGASLTRFVAECEQTLAAAGLSPHLHSFGTEVEGDWETVTAAIGDCHQRLHALGAPRVLTTVKLLTRTDREPSLSAPVRHVEQSQANLRQSIREDNRS